METEAMETEAVETEAVETEAMETEVVGSEAPTEATITLVTTLAAEPKAKAQTTSIQTKYSSRRKMKETMPLAHSARKVSKTAKVSSPIVEKIGDVATTMMYKRMVVEAPTKAVILKVLTDLVGSEALTEVVMVTIVAAQPKVKMR